VASLLPALLAWALASAPEAPQAPAAPVAEPPRAPAAISTSTPLPTPLPTPAASGKASPGPATHATPIGTPPRPEKAEAPASRPTPRSLSHHALGEELRDSSRKRREELSAIQSERQKLEKLRLEIEAARQALREETGRLQDLTAQAEKKASARPVRPGAGGPEAGKSVVEQLARTVKGMKPDQAAHVVARLEKPLAVELLRRMRPADTAQLLDRMKPEAAAEMVALLAAQGGSP